MGKNRFALKLSNNVEDWPVDLQEEYEERVAIMEFDGGLKRREAERLAKQRIQFKYEKDDKL